MPLSPELSQPRKHRLILLALWLIFYGSFTLFSPPLLDDADSVHAEVAREMLLRHDFVTLYANGIRYLEKAPLYYWSMAASLKLFGLLHLSETAASRLPLALSVLLLALLLEAFARRASASARAGLYAGLITLSSFGIFIFSRINIPDILVCLFLTAALYCYYLTEQQPPATTPRARVPSAPCLLFAAFLALNVLTKGLIGIVFPIAIVAAHLLFTRGLRSAFARLRHFHLLPSLAVFLLIAAPWHILIAIANPGHGHPAPISHASGHWQVPYPTDGNVHGWAWFYFVNEQLYRYLNLRVPHDYDTSPLWLFLGLIFIWLMPWSAYLPATIARACRSVAASSNWFPSRSAAEQQATAESGATPPARLNLLLLLWLAIPLAFFLFSTRQEYYVLPALPPMILLLAGFLERSSIWSNAAGGDGLVLEDSSDDIRTSGILAHRIATVLLALGALLSLTCLAFLLRTHAPAPGVDLATLLTQNPADYALSFGHILDLTGPALFFFRLPLILTALAFFLGPLANFLFRRQARPHAATLVLAAASFVFLFAAWLGLRTFSPTLTSYQLAQAIERQLQPQDLIVIHGEYEAGSTLGFYLHRNDLHILEGRSSNLWYGSFFPDAPPIFETRSTLAARWPGPQRIFLWQDPHDPDRPALTPHDLPTPIYLIAASGGKQILSNRPGP